MGDAGPPLPTTLGEDGGRQKEVTVFVTGFGPFKNFHRNPSNSITTLLPPVLLPANKPPLLPLSSSSSSSAPTTQPLIHLLIHPHPIRVSYPTVATTIPHLLSTLKPDYILHIGMAAGRRHYALETLAHRDGYTIKDIDGTDGLDVGSRRWNAEGCPAVLEAGWHKTDVLNRWRSELRSDNTTPALAAKPIPDVRLSNDAGRFVCDFIFYQSLSTRWKEAHFSPPPPSSSASFLSWSSPPLENPPSSLQSPRQLQTEREEEEEEEEEVQDQTRLSTSSQEGKVAFLHVPGDTDPVAIERGVRVTEAAIRALVASWEEGFRREGGD